ncbi:MAG: glucose-1-phosphate thymidylyltransferase [Planctomycetes bacterium]|nr:glucose-1-phosphate thymidylyltransferase [Planctomycetota bacterium]
MTGNIILFEDEHVDKSWPVTLTRPAFDISIACFNLYEIAHMADDNISFIVRDYLDKVVRRSFKAGPVGDGPTLFLNASVVPDVGLVQHLEEMLSSGDAVLCTCGQRVSAALLPADREIPMDLWPEKISGFLLGQELPLEEDSAFETLDYPFQIVDNLERLFPGNIERKLSEDGFSEDRPGVFVGDDVELPKNAVFHTEDGPVVLDRGVKVLDFTFFEGPVYIGPNSRIIERSSMKEYVSTSHTCKIGGEVEASTLQAYTNKQHHGFLGHSYIGSWVNLGAGTSNSDLKNTYGKVRVDHQGERLETDMQFLGSIIGDYAKTAINTSIFTGKTIGVGSMLYGYVGQNVPSFCNYARSFGQVTEVPADQAIITQRRMFERRDVEQTEADRKLVKAAFELTRGERQISDDPPVF